MSKRYAVGGYETNRYEDGYHVYDTTLGFYEGMVADFKGQCQIVRRMADALADKLNGIEAAKAEQAEAQSTPPETTAPKQYEVGGYEADRYTGGFRVYDARLGFYEGKVADFDGGSNHVRGIAYSLADRLNGVTPDESEDAQVLAVA